MGAISMSLIDYSVAELMVISGTVLLICLLLSEIFDWMLHGFGNTQYIYGYKDYNGPLTWKWMFPQSKGKRQSPINIPCRSSIVVPAETLPILRFSAEYKLPPKYMKAYNDNHCVTICACWENDNRPTICGGPICDTYAFVNLKFRWGPSDEEGSEHTVDLVRYAMEVQATHVKLNGMKYLDLQSAVEAKTVLIISYFYKITPVDNPYLEPIISTVCNLKQPFTRCNLEPVPLSWLMPSFTSKYFIYQGSLTYPPCTEGVLWMIQPEPLGISSRQVRKFRKLMSKDGIMDLNTRPIQELSNRNIYFYD